MTGTQSQKRKYRQTRNEDQGTSSTSERRDVLETLVIEAREADLITSQHARAALLEAPTAQSRSGDGATALLKWSAYEDEEVWVDRYDARLLLTSLPALESRQEPEPQSPSGWSDLPSDSEDVFFFSHSEAEDFRWQKRRRLLDESREQRLRILREMNGYDDDDVAIEEPWGDSDEEPDETQKALMRRTASHIVTSANPFQLEARILANHGADKRFAFLRGRWKRTWRTLKLVAEAEKKEEEEKSKNLATTTLTGLIDYGDSEDSDTADTAPQSEEHPDLTINECTNYGSSEAAVEARRARAREWSARRRAEKLSGS